MKAVDKILNLIQCDICIDIRHLGNKRDQIISDDFWPFACSTSV